MSSQNEKISIIVPVYNAGEFLVDCVRSVQAQTYQYWELLLIDDGSTDGCSAICDAFAKASSRIHVYHQNNKGVSAARNVGIQNAAGEYLCFLDADDWVEPFFLQELHKAIGLAQIALCGVEDGNTFSPVAECISIKTMRMHPSQYAHLTYTNYAINKLYRREILLPKGPRFDERMKRGEDAAFVALCFQRCRMIVSCPQILYHYRMNTKSSTHHFYSGVCRDEHVLFRLQKGIFKIEALSEKETEFLERWEYGKIISVLRYICCFAPSKAARIEYTQQFLDEREIFMRFTKLPIGIGGRSLLYAALAKSQNYALLTEAIRLLG